MWDDIKAGWDRIFGYQTAPAPVIELPGRQPSGVYTAPYGSTRPNPFPERPTGSWANMSNFVVNTPEPTTIDRKLLEQTAAGLDKQYGNLFDSIDPKLTGKTGGDSSLIPGFSWNEDTFKLLEVLGNLYSAKSQNDISKAELGLARESLAKKEAQWQKDYEAQRTAFNNQMANQNAWKLASGRSDLGAYVGNWDALAGMKPATTA